VSEPNSDGALEPVPEPEPQPPEQGELFPRVDGLSVSASYSAPIPSPAMLEQYNNVSPGLGTRIADEWLNGVKADREITVSESAAEVVQAKNGQQIAGWLTFICVLFAVIFGFRHQYIPMGTILSPPLLVLIGQFIRRRRS